jgi:hypothetical protein
MLCPEDGGSTLLRNVVCTIHCISRFIAIYALPLGVRTLRTSEAAYAQLVCSTGVFFYSKDTDSKQLLLFVEERRQ